MTTYTVQYTQFGMVEVIDHDELSAAEATFARITGDPDTTEALLCAGPDNGAPVMRQYRRDEDAA